MDCSSSQAGGIPLSREVVPEVGGRGRRGTGHLCDDDSCHGNSTPSFLFDLLRRELKA